MISIFGLFLGSVVTAAIFGPYPAVATLLLGATVAPFAYLVSAARRLTLLGFSHHDVGPAFRNQIEQSREELVVEHPTPPSIIERSLPFFVRLFGGIMGISFVGIIVSAMAELHTAGPVLLTSLAFSGIATILTSVAHLAHVQKRRDVDTEMWSNLWLGRVGKAAFGIARKLLGNRVRESATTHRATELSLGMAAEQLLESLPKSSRQALGDLPGLLKRLQEDAQLLRKRYNELQEVLGDASDASSDNYSDVRSARDTVQAKLGEAVGALEMIRLNLLRLHAGSATVASLTTHLGLAAEISEQVERLIAAQDEVDRTLQFPRLASPTPV